MSVTDDRWSCVDCGVTEHRPDGAGERWQAAAQHGHAARHAAERSQAMSTPDALVRALETWAELRVRLVVAPADLDRMRAEVVRRGLPLEVWADGDLEPGRSYVMQPRRGYR